jgi:CDP-glycerol glycerophosphotransferase (TagB/SpsB family)
MKMDIGKPHHWILLLQQWLYTLIAIGWRFLRKPPKQPLVILYGHQLSGNLLALYTEWSNSARDDIDLYYLSLDPDYSNQLSEAGINVLRCNRLRDMFKLSQTSVLVTDHGLHAMIPLLRFTDIVFIDVWHGIPFKGFIPEDFKLQHRYHEVWVSSPHLKKLYEDKFGFKPERVRSMGYARTDRLFKGDRNLSQFKTEAGIPQDSKIVLYAPTWQQDDTGRELFPFGESKDAFIRVLSKICRDHRATLVIRGHLNANMASASDEGVHYCSQMDFPDTEDLLLVTDILICDWSSIAFDYLVLNRPTLFLDVDPPFKNGFSLGKEYRFGKVLGDMTVLGNALVDYLEYPEHYLRDHSELNNTILREVYGENNSGTASAKQLERLVTLTDSYLQ